MDKQKAEAIEIFRVNKSSGQKGVVARLSSGDHVGEAWQILTLGFSVPSGFQTISIEIHFFMFLTFVKSNDTTK